MLELWNEKARRAVFFSGYEMTQTKSEEVSTEHLLLGLIREDMYLFSKLLPGGKEGTEKRASLLKSIRNTIPRGDHEWKTREGELPPFSISSKRVLDRVRDIMEARGVLAVGPVFLLLALLDQGGESLVKILLEHGITKESVEKQFQPSVVCEKPTNNFTLDELQVEIEKLLKLLRKRTDNITTDNITLEQWASGLVNQIVVVHKITGGILNK